MFSTFIALVFSATTGLRCELNINDRQQVWQISADVDAHLFTARSKYDGTISKHTAMMTVEAGYPDTLALVLDDKILDIKLNGNAFLQSPYVGEDRTYVGHCDQAEFEGL